MKQRIWAGLVIGALASTGALTVACGDDDHHGSSDDGGIDGGNTGGRGAGGKTGTGGKAGSGGSATGGTAGDGGAGAGGSGTGGGSDVDAGDGGPVSCTFASYVIGLITDSTNPRAQPDKSLGAQCTDSTTQAEFKSLFP